MPSQTREDRRSGKRVKSLFATHETNTVADALEVGVCVAIVEIDAPGVDRIGRINIAAPVPGTGGIGKVVRVDDRTVGATVHDGQQLTPGGDAPAAALTPTLSQREGQGGCSRVVGFPALFSRLCVTSVNLIQRVL